MIAHTPDIRGGRPCIAGTGVTVQRIVGWYKLGLSPEEIADELGHLTLAQVYAALAYYHANREEIEAGIAADEAEAGRLIQQHGQTTRSGQSSRLRVFGPEVVMAEKVVLEVPGEVLEGVRLPPDEIEGEFRLELALALYQRKVLSLGKARLLAGMDRWEFERVLGKRKVPRHYVEADLEEDIRYAQRHQ